MTNESTIKQVAVIGAGTLGAQIAIMTAASGRTVRLYDAVPEATQRAFTRLRTMLEPVVAAGALSWDLDDAFSRLHESSTLEEAVADADLVIEAVREHLETKQQVFQQISAANPSALLATNSSSIPSSLLAEFVADPGRLVNLHFFTEFWKRSCVELMSCGHTTPEVMATLEQFGTSLGLYCAVVQGESKGFIINRIWRAIKRESLAVVDQGVANPEDVDRLFAMFWSCDKGPFAAMDQVGLDVIADIEDSYIEISPDPTDVRSHTLHTMLAEGKLGEKSGIGFYEYPNPSFRKAGWPKEST